MDPSGNEKGTAKNSILDWLKNRETNTNYELTKVAYNGTRDTADGGDRQPRFVNVDEIKKSAVMSATEIVEDILDQYDYSLRALIGEYAAGRFWTDQFNDSVARRQGIRSSINHLILLIDLGINLYFTKGATGSTKLDTGYAVVSTFAPESGPTLKSTIGEIDYKVYDKEVVRNAIKMQVIDKMSFKYIIFDAKARNVFINKIEEQEKKIKNMEIRLFGTREENAKYKITLLEHLKYIKLLNVNYSRNYQEYKRIIKEIDDMYK